MFKKLAVLALGFIFLLSIAGCATAKRKQQTEMELQGLKNQVSVLEAQVQSKDEEISSLRSQLDAQAASSAVPQGKNKGFVSKRTGNWGMDVQTALKNAGFYKGQIDGKIGPQTVAAIKEFQKANNLKANGKVNRSTWRLLKAHLNKEAAKPEADHLK